MALSFYTMRPRTRHGDVQRVIGFDKTCTSDRARLRALRHPPALAIWDAGYDDEHEGQWDASRAAAAAAVAMRSQPAPARRKRARPTAATTTPAAEPTPAFVPDAIMEDVYDGDSEG